MTEAVFNAMGYNNTGVKSFCCDRNAVSVIAPLLRDG